MELFLGIDLGTTAVKIVLIDGSKKIHFEREKEHNALQTSAADGGGNRHEQCPKQILHTVRELLEEFDANELKDLVKGIAVSGQMHGVVLWNDSTLRSSHCINHCNCSRLITWMDSRCDQHFLQKLPKWMDANKTEKRIATGYGLATLAWLKANNELKDWDRAGTIMDFLVSYLTQSEKAYISTQNAEAWGFCSSESAKWTIQISYFMAMSNNGRNKSKFVAFMAYTHISQKFNFLLFYDSSDIFPTHLLPTIVPPGTVVGRTSVPSPKFPLDIPIFVALGDLQTSLLPILHNGEAALHIGTASQLAFIARPNAPQNSNSTAVRRDPYFDGDYLLVAPSLNGGNVFDCFFGQLSSWFSRLFGPHQLDHSRIYELLDQILSSSTPSTSTRADSPLTIHPTFYGERHAPATATVINWHSDVVLDEFICSFARGIVANLAQMMPQSILISHGISRLKLIGRANQRAFIEEAKRQFPDIEIVSEEEKISAAFGSALHAQESIWKIVKME